MAHDFNSCTFLGRLARDVELKSVGDHQLGTFAIAVGWKTKDKEGVEFFDCEVWNRQAEIAATYLSKGKQVLISGSLGIDKWEKDGVKHSRPKIRVQTFHLLGAKAESAPPKSVEVDKSGFVPDEDIPF